VAVWESTGVIEFVSFSPGFDQVQVFVLFLEPFYGFVVVKMLNGELGGVKTVQTVSD